MMSTIENPKMTIEDLNNAEESIKANKAKAEDYERLDKYISFIGAPDNFLLNKLKESNVDGYEDFIYQRRVAPSSNLNMLVGTALGVISILKKHVSGK